MTELYLPLSNHAVFCQWHYYIPSFKFLDTAPPPQSLPTTNRLVKFGPPNPSPPPPPISDSTKNEKIKYKGTCIIFL